MNLVRYHPFFSVLDRSVEQKFDWKKNPSRARMDRFHGTARWKAVLMALRASLNSARSSISSSFSEEFFLEPPLGLAEFMLNILTDSFELDMLCSSDHP